MIDPRLAERLRAELRRRNEKRRAALAHLRETFAELGPAADEPPRELEDLSPEELAQLTVNVLGPPSAEERRAQALKHLDDVFGPAPGSEGMVP